MQAALRCPVPAALEQGHTSVACAVLRGFHNAVRIAGAAGQLTELQVEQFSTHATRIRTTLGCR